MDIFVYLTLCFTSLFTLMDPLGVMPVFLQMTDGMDTTYHRDIALKACTIAFIILVLFTLSGRFLFHFFGISTRSEGPGRGFAGSAVPLSECGEHH